MATFCNAFYESYLSPLHTFHPWLGCGGGGGNNDRRQFLLINFTYGALPSWPVTYDVIIPPPLQKKNPVHFYSFFISGF